MKPNPALLLSILSCLFIPGIGSAVPASYTVPATANIFAAGLSAPVAPAGGGAGTLPFLFSIAPGQGNVFQFQASGSMSYYYSQFYAGPDGGAAGAVMNMNGYGGISGYHGNSLALVGVFLTDATPQAPAPSTLDFSAGGLGRNFPNLSPEIGQLFFIGDGQTDGAFTQTFYTPVGATRLYLGVPDCYNSQGDPGYYGDNEGSLTVAVNQIPEPGSAALIGVGITLLLAARRRATVLAAAS
jgi:hypothetical protein